MINTQIVTNLGDTESSWVLTFRFQNKNRKEVLEIFIPPTGEVRVCSDEDSEPCPECGELPPLGLDEFFGSPLILDTVALTVQKG